tara:strand:- start:2890 stop:3729 length:840 start_codon:yes stop_codon:yes gene_type:complete
MRDNSKRFAASADPAPAVAEVSNMLDFSTPTEIVDLPSRGRFYSEAHPLHNQETVEVKYMTAKDEDILTSPTLLKKGIAVDRFLQNILLDKRINVNSLLSGDKNAILVASRINGFGAEYTTKVNCPGCSAVTENTFDLSEVQEYLGDDLENHDIRQTERGTFVIKLPRTGFEAEVRLLNNRDENELAAKMQQNKKGSAYETNLTDQLRKILVSVNGVEDKEILNQFITHLPAFDSRHLRAAYLKVVPGLDMTQHFACSACGFEKEVDIPLTVDFFWAKQ